MPTFSGGPASVTSYGVVDTPVVCTMTRITLRSFWTLPRSWRAYRHVTRESTQIPGLLRTAFLLESPRTFVILAIWRDDQAILQFGTSVMSHLRAVRRALSDAHADDHGVQIWSTEWRLHAASHNLNWPPVETWQDIREALVVARRMREVG